VLVPLCGKSEDLAYLAAHGHEVIGVELVETAVREFFAEHDITPHVEDRGPFVAFTAGAITVLAGDFFATTPELVGHVDSIYDRAALIALPPPLRARYVPQLRTIAPRAERILLVTLEYPEGTMDGPPFSVDEAEVRALYKNAPVEVLDQGADPRGRAGVIERCYAITAARPTP
jgi:thiopurine S-methyltransferase